MAERVCRNLRDGGLDGEHAPALMIKDSSLTPFGDVIFFHFLSRLLSDIVSANSLSRGLVLVALCRSPSCYLDLLKRSGLDPDRIASRLRFLDCYTDPRGWIDMLSRDSQIGIPQRPTISCSELFTDITNLDKLFSSTISLGKEFNLEGKLGFSIAVDSVSELLRNTSIQSVAHLLTSIRTCGQVFSTFWLANADFHHDREVASLEYLSSMVVIAEPLKRPVDDLNHQPLPEPRLRKGKLLVRSKLRNGRVRITENCFVVESEGVRFIPQPVDDDSGTTKALLPKVQFNLQLTEKEIIDRSKVLLPYEHQGNGRPIEIYEGRVHSKEEVKAEGSSEIIYFRDSDEEARDSDEDPDDDLDI